MKLALLVAVGATAALFMASCASTERAPSSPVPTRASSSPSSQATRGGATPTASVPAPTAKINVPFPMEDAPAGVAPLGATTLQTVTAYVRARVTGSVSVAKIGWAQATVAGAAPMASWEIAIVGDFYPDIAIPCPAGVPLGTKLADTVPVFKTGVVILDQKTLAVTFWNPTGAAAPLATHIACHAPS